MLQAVRTGVFVAVYASCILRLLASVLQPASAIIWREFLTKTRQTGAAERQATLGAAQSTDNLPRITAAQTAARRDAPELKPATATGATRGRRRRAPTPDSHQQEERRSAAISETKEKRR